MSNQQSLGWFKCYHLITYLFENALKLYGENPLWSFPRVKELKCTLPNILFIIIICPWFITSNWMSPECLPQWLNQSKLQVDYNIKKSLQTKQQKWLNFTFLILAEIFRVNSTPKFNRFNLWHLKSLWNEEKKILPFTDYTSKPNLWSIHVAIWKTHVTSLLRLIL